MTALGIALAMRIVAASLPVLPAGCEYVADRGAIAVAVDGRAMACAWELDTDGVRRIYCAPEVLP